MTYFDPKYYATPSEQSELIQEQNRQRLRDYGVVFADALLNDPSRLANFALNLVPLAQTGRWPGSETIPLVARDLAKEGEKASVRLGPVESFVAGSLAPGIPGNPRANLGVEQKAGLVEIFKGLAHRSPNPEEYARNLVQTMLTLRPEKVKEIAQHPHEAAFLRGIEKGSGQEDRLYRLKRLATRNLRELEEQFRRGGPVIIPRGGLHDDEELGRLVSRVTSRTGLYGHPQELAILQGNPSPLESLVGDDLRVMADFLNAEGITHSIGPPFGVDDLGEFYPPEQTVMLLRSGKLSPETFRATVAHEVGHALLGIRDKDSSTGFFIRYVEGSRGDELDSIMKELKRVSQEVRPKEWEKAINLSNSKELHHREVGAEWIEYASRSPELLADGISFAILSPEQLKQLAPKFHAALLRMNEGDPRMADRIQFRVFFPFALAGEALREAEHAQSE
jgi:hypothetical protein